MFHRILFLLLIISSLYCNFNRCADCFQSFSEERFPEYSKWSESILRVKSEPESCPSPSQVESQVSGIPFFSQTTRSSSMRMASGKRAFIIYLEGGL